MQDTTGAALENATVSTHASINGQAYTRSAYTDATGAYTLGLIDGSWLAGAYYIGDTAASRLNFPAFPLELPGARPR